MDFSKEYIITTDCAGAIGEKEHDLVTAPNEMISYFTTRNAVIENLSKGGIIQTISYANFIGDKALPSIEQGIKTVTKHFPQTIEVVGSTESNFDMNQSALSVTVIGKTEPLKKKRYNNFCAIGLPLVGNEVLSHKEHIVTLEEILLLLNNDSVSRIIPVGSKGINDRAKTVLGFLFQSDTIDLHKSAGPSTTILVEYNDYDLMSKGIKTVITKLQIKQ